jgi:hypothetical protein
MTSGSKAEATNSVSPFAFAEINPPFSPQLYVRWPNLSILGMVGKNSKKLILKLVSGQEKADESKSHW